MAFTFHRNQDIPDEIRRLAHEQLEKALAALKQDKLPPDEVIHECRKRCKHIRALLRLLRSCAADVARGENKAVREMAGDLSHLRDSHVRMQTFQLLFQDGNSNDRFPETHTLLAESADSRLQGKAFSGERKRFQERAEALRDRIDEWEIEKAGFECVRDSMKDSYKQGRRAMKKALKEPTAEYFHEWRKRVKEFGYHLDLFKEAWPSLLKSYHNQVDKLGEILGKLNDLNVLQQYLAAAPGISDDELQEVLALIASHKGPKELEAELLGKRVFAERPKDLMRRLSVYWKVWQTSAVE